MGVGIRLKNILRDKSITIKQLAETTGISVNTLYSITKRDSERVDDVILQRIAAALGVGVGQLMPVDNYWEDADGNGHTEPMEPPAAAPKDRIDAALDRLNDEGQEKAAERVEELTEIPKYQK